MCAVNGGHPGRQDADDRQQQPLRCKPHHQDGRPCSARRLLDPGANCEDHGPFPVSEDTRQVLLTACRSYDLTAVYIHLRVEHCLERGLDAQDWTVWLCICAGIDQYRPRALRLHRLRQLDAAPAAAGAAERCTSLRVDSCSSDEMRASRPRTHSLLNILCERVSLATGGLPALFEPKGSGSIGVVQSCQLYSAAYHSLTSIQHSTSGCGAMQYRNRSKENPAQLL
jgi:hypothetical protein